MLIPTAWLDAEHVRRLYLLITLAIWLHSVPCHAYGVALQAWLKGPAIEPTKQGFLAAGVSPEEKLASASGMAYAPKESQTAEVSSGLQTIPLFSASSGVSITPKAAVDTSAELLSADKMWERLQNTKAVGEQYYGFVQDLVWMGFTLENYSEITPWYLEVSNNHINHIHLYTRVRSQDGPSEWVESAVTGRASRFSTRPIPHVNFVFDNAPGD